MRLGFSGAGLPAAGRRAALDARSSRPAPRCWAARSLADRRAPRSPQDRLRGSRIAAERPQGSPRWLGLSDAPRGRQCPAGPPQRAAERLQGLSPAPWDLSGPLRRSTGLSVPPATATGSGRPKCQLAHCRGSSVRSCPALDLSPLRRDHPGTCTTDHSELRQARLSKKRWRVFRDPVR